MNRLKGWVEHLENRRISFKGLMITVLCIIFLRNFLETFSDTDNFWTPVTSLAYFVHYPLFYFCLILTLSIVFYWLCKERIEKVTMMVFLFFPVVLLAPILDLLISNGQGHNISYLFGDQSFLIYQFIPFYLGYNGGGVTPGIQIELLIAFMLAGSYLYLKTGKVIKAALGVVSFYITVFLLGAIPSIVTVLWNLGGSVISPKEMFGGEIVLFHFYSFDHKLALFLFPILIGELCLWFWCYDRRKFLAVVRNLRGLRVVHYICMLGFGMILGYSQTSHLDLFISPFSILIITASVFSGIFAWWYAVGINDIYDFETDKIANPSRPMVTGVINSHENRVLNAIFLVLSLVAAFIVRYPFFVSILLVIGLSYIYSSPPLRLKRIPILSTFVIALCSTIVCLAGFVVFSDSYSFHGFPPGIILTILVTFTLAFNVIDIKDIKGDRITGTVTLPILFGERKGKMVIGALVLIAYLCIPVFLKSYSLIPVALVFGIVTYMLINRKQMREAPIFLLYFVFLGITLYCIYIQIQSGKMTIFG